MSFETSYMLDRSIIPSPMDPFNDSRHSVGGITLTSLSEPNEYDYVKWINRYLVKASPPIAISDITESNVRNGVALGLLLEIMGGIKLNGLLLQPGTRVERLHNVHELFAVLRRLNVRLGNLQPEDVMSGDKDTIIQLIYAISSHFTRPTRGRRSVSPGHRMFDGRGFSDTTRSSPRHTPIGRYTPTYRCNPPLGPSTDNRPQSEHYTEIINPVYSHQFIGPTVYDQQSGRTSPRSRSTMTMLFSGQRSPTGMRRCASRESDVSSLPCEARPSGKPRSSENRLDRVGTLEPSNHHPHPTYGSVHRSPAPHHSNLHNQLQSELAQYIESMNELSSLKTQLGTISRLSPCTHRQPIASETPQLPPHLQTAMFPTKSVQTEHQQDLASDIHEAQVQIIELTKMLQAKDAVLRQREQENARLVDAVNRLREALEHTGIQANSHSAVDNHQNHYTPSLNTRRSTERSPYSGAPSSHSYDPRHFSTGIQSTPNASHRQGSSSLTRIGYPSNTRLQQAVPGAPKTEATHVKQMSVNVNRNQAGFYGEDVYVPVERY
ncbi:hypothetical protein CRM22_010171 [Opisthorchis felineus]|uniref:Calponin-homology (CH) domain-containing protein n=1 Tax=Opisthorchis felineus TaxID=147828 RepID=A0A4S2L7B7_OPIFE|nr:hypothetical protein CRM22_010171 [Opisthorchis felineus]